MKAKETVSLCMIVKDEEHCILAAIESVRNLTDELIVVDTGSTDNTQQSVLAAGAKLFNLEWTKDFSVARNFALEQAASNWIIVLDADEVLEAIEPQAFYKLLTDSQVEGYFLRINNHLDSAIRESCDQVVRLFRNRPDYRFEGAIHEQVAPSILRANNGCGLASVPLTIHHYGYLKDNLNSKEKFSRNSEIIMRELQQNPDNPFLLYCLGLEYFQQNSIHEGLNHLTKALARMSGNEGYFEDALLNIALGYLRLEKAALLIDFLDKALSMYPDQADFFYLRGLAHLQQLNYGQATADFERTLCIGTIQLATVYQVNCLLGDAYHASGNYLQAQDAYTRALVYKPSSYPLQQLVSLIKKGCPIECLFERILLVESWPNSESWQGLRTSFTSTNLEPYLVMFLLSLYRTFNTDSYDDQELLATFSFFLKASENRITESNLDITQNTAYQCLTLTLKEIQVCIIALIKDMENADFTIKNRVNSTLIKTFFVLCQLVD